MHSTTPPDAPPAARWERLLHDGAPVGYRRAMGKTVLFSRDGYGWSGTPIEHDQRMPDTRLRDVRKGRVYHGDIVRMPLGAKQPRLVEAVVLVHPRHGTLLWLPRLERTHPLDTVWPPPYRPSALHIVGHVLERPRLAEQVDVVLSRWRPADPNARLDSTRLALATVVGAVAAVGLQFALLGAVGPIATWLGALAGAIVWFARHRAVRPTRAVMLAAAAWGAFKAGGLCTAGIGVALATGVVEVAQPVATLVVLAIASTFGAGIAHVLAGDLIVWRGGGYGGEGGRSE